MCTNYPNNDYYQLSQQTKFDGKVQVYPKKTGIRTAIQWASEIARLYNGIFQNQHKFSLPSRASVKKKSLVACNVSLCVHLFVGLIGWSVGGSAIVFFLSMCSANTVYTKWATKPPKPSHQMNKTRKIPCKIINKEETWATKNPNQKVIRIKFIGNHFLWLLLA